MMIVNVSIICEWMCLSGKYLNRMHAHTHTHYGHIFDDQDHIRIDQSIADTQLIESVMQDNRWVIEWVSEWERLSSDAPQSATMPTCLNINIVIMIFTMQMCFSNGLTINPVWYSLIVGWYIFTNWIRMVDCQTNNKKKECNVERLIAVWPFITIIYDFFIFDTNRTTTDVNQTLFNVLMIIGQKKERKKERKRHETIDILN